MIMDEGEETISAFSTVRCNVDEDRKLYSADGWGFLQQGGYIWFTKANPRHCCWSITFSATFSGHNTQHVR